MNLKTVKKIMSLLFVVMVGSIILGSFFMNANSSFLVGIMAVAVVGLFGTYLLFWRCPNCKKIPGKFNAVKCQHCGHRLDV